MILSLAVTYNISSTLWLLVAVVALLWLLVLLYQSYSRRSHMYDAVSPLESLSMSVSLGRHCGVHSIQGARPHMEDTFYGDSNKAFFGVYDGHGGSRCSHFVARTLHTLVYQNTQNMNGATDGHGSGASNSTLNPTSDDVTAALTESYLSCDRQWLDLAAHNGWDDGTTAVSALVINRTLYVANVGDSRAVLCKSNGSIVELSHDHKPSRIDERQRIEAIGGRIIHYGTWRVEGILAVTRAIGDRKLKRFVTAMPEVKVHQLQDDDDTLILASDGVWDVITSQQAADIVRRTDDVKVSAEKLTTAAYEAHSQDNITTLVIDLRPYR